MLHQPSPVPLTSKYNILQFLHTKRRCIRDLIFSLEQDH
jgi:hypothetical protein